MQQISCRIPGIYSKQLKSIMDKINSNSISTAIRICIRTTYDQYFKYDTTSDTKYKETLLRETIEIREAVFVLMRLINNSELSDNDFSTIKNAINKHSERRTELNMNYINNDDA
ncbi:hypothetical protein Dacet_0638 [Denitrovibrio acetiphilus DSM 12809]|uniref:Uncharacterized protein n=1 Tax=Denitrovibrio acetiphilus (strain DSM 12809 / NBRC 114555 / N2460) TaxID=522772 RepID=D4H4N3_DENA2|nr:hypothetical protein [Denitrovibrio acetiphilus]ADD67427.1 hypothetical protein Dacet_0638 [Denitrovibrio acetiphilus DSM 12809]